MYLTLWDCTSFDEENKRLNRMGQRFFSMLVTRKRKKLLGFVCVWRWVIPENIHTSYSTDDFHILTPPPPPSLPSEFPNCIILPYPRNSIPPPLFAFIFSSNPSELLTLDSGNSGMKIRSFLFATFQQMRPTLPLNCPELVQNIKELQILNGVLSQ